jgi:Ca2+-binding RTX toxin-like protein
MLALLLIPALLGFALIIDSDDDTDDTETTGGETVDPSGEDLGTGQTITTILEAGENSFDGTGANDRIDDTDEASEISGGAGNDFIQGRGGFDTIDGGTGNDTIFAGSGEDSATGGDGNDRVFLGDGDDIYAPEFDETDATPEFSADANRGNDFVRGGSGDDAIVDFNGSDTIFGDVGDDMITTFGSGSIPDAPDTADGGAGNDVLIGDHGDLLTGGSGEDLFAVVNPINMDTDAVTITDFNTEEDTLIAFVPEADQSNEEIELRYDASANALRAFWRGDEVAVLNGLTSADAANVDVTVIDAQDLQRAGFA